MSCPLCHSNECDPLPPNHFLCGRCDFRFLHPAARLAADAERYRYDQHNNDANDEGYQNFVRPLAKWVAERLPPGARGLDFGAGETAIAATLLRKKSFTLDVYDTYYWPDPTAFTKTYDFIVASEVFEHLYSPHEEIARLKKMLNRGGTLFVMTLLFTPEIDFEKWYYRLDPTHVGFFSARSFEWIRSHFGFSSMEIRAPRLARLTT